MIPDYQALMLPLLKFIKDGQVYKTQEAVDALAKEFRLNEDELNEWLPSKRQKTFHNRVHWAKAHLKMANVIENVGRGLFKITERGKSILQESPNAINVKYLTKKYSDYNDLINGFRKRGEYKISFSTSIPEVSDFIGTAEEKIESGYQELRKSLEQDVLDKLKSVHRKSLKR